MNSSDIQCCVNVTMELIQTYFDKWIEHVLLIQFSKKFCFIRFRLSPVMDNQSYIIEIRVKDKVYYQYKSILPYIIDLTSGFYSQLSYTIHNWCLDQTLRLFGNFWVWLVVSGRVKDPQLEGKQSQTLEHFLISWDNMKGHTLAIMQLGFSECNSMCLLYIKIYYFYMW